MSRFIRQGKMKWRLVPTVAGYAAGTGPTASEITAGTDITKKVAGHEGFMLEGSEVEVPDYASTFNGKIPGTDSVGATSLTLYADDTADTVRPVLAKGTETYVYIDKGTGKFDLFPVTVMTVGDDYSIGNEPARYRVQFSIPSEPLTELSAAS